MLKNILKLKGAQELTKNEQKSIKGTHNCWYYRTQHYSLPGTIQYVKYLKLVHIMIGVLYVLSVEM